MIDAKVICDSAGPHGHRLTTFSLLYPKFIHGEFMTHRVFSRNASISRAIPVAKLIAEVRDDALRAGPVYWGAEQKGMQSGEELSDVIPTPDGINPVSHLSPRNQAINQWKLAAMNAADTAAFMVKIGVHKSIVNRILEPFSHIRVVCTATEYMNFFGLRLSKAAQPEMRALAEAMWRAYNESEPKQLQPGEWHLPFVDDLRKTESRAEDEDNQNLAMVSVARCARVSYESHDTGRHSTVEEDLKLAERLRASGHWSPFEHQATPDDSDGTFSDDHGKTGRLGGWEHTWEHGNFVGWRQLRKMMPGEACATLPEEYRR